MIVGWLKVRLSSCAGSGRSPASIATAPLAATKPRLVRDATPTTNVRTTARKIRPSGIRCGLVRYAARRAPRTARVRGDSRTGVRPEGSLRAEPVIGASLASDSAHLHHRLEEPEVLDLSNGPATPGGPEAVEQRNEVPCLALRPAARLE